MSKFKVGDRVKVVGAGKVYDTYEKWFQEYAPSLLEEWRQGRHYGAGYSTRSLEGRVLVVGQHLDRWRYRTLYLVRATDLSLFLIDERGIELVERPSHKATKIVITADGKTTLARLYEGKTVIASAEAKCAPSDTFDFAIGAKLAFERLMGKPGEPDGEKPQPEPIKLYCAKGYKPGVFLTKDKVYEIDDKGNLVYDDGYKENWKSKPEYLTGTCPHSEFLIPLIKRPAKVGEWVYAASDPMARYDEFKKGDILRVVKYGYGTTKDDGARSDCRAYYKAEQRKYLSPDEYLVLDGYQPEPEEPEYYSGKVVCVAEVGTPEYFTVGRVYEYKDGLIESDRGGGAYNINSPARTIEEALNRKFVTFVEYKGEAGQ